MVFQDGGSSTLVREPQFPLTETDIDQEVAGYPAEDLEFYYSEAFRTLNDLRSRPESNQNAMNLARYRYDAVERRLDKERRPAKAPDAGLAQFDQGRMDVVDETTSVPAGDSPLITPENQQMAEPDAPAPIKELGKSDPQTPEEQAAVDDVRRNFAEAVEQVDAEIAKQKERAQVLLKESEQREQDLTKWIDDEHAQQEKLRAIIGGTEEVEKGTEEW